jgi:hypothetical protein
MRRGLIAIVCAAAGCGAVGVESLGTVETGGDSQSLAFVDLVGDGKRDIVVVSRSRGTVDVLSEKGAGLWGEMKASFFAGGVAVEVTAGRVDKKDMIAVRDDNGSVALLDRDTLPHRLDFPIQAYRRFRNGTAVDQVPPAAGMSLGDLDGDGDDELVVAAPSGVMVVEHLKELLLANPEKAPPGNGFIVKAGASPASAAAVDINGDGLLDLVAVDAQESRVYTMLNAGGGRGRFEAPRVAELPARGLQVVRTGCKESPAALVLGNGHLMSVTPSGAVKPMLSGIADAKKLASSGDALVITATSGAYIYDACSSIGGKLGMPMKSYLHLAVAQTATPGAQQIAVLADDSKSVSVMKVFSGF